MRRPITDPCGTTRMGKDISHGVVDGEPDVFGVKRLRVMDASVIPLVPDTRIQNVVYMIAEKVSRSVLLVVMVMMLTGVRSTERRLHQARSPCAVWTCGRPWSDESLRLSDARVSRVSME